MVPILPRGSDIFCRYCQAMVNQAIAARYPMKVMVARRVDVLRGLVLVSPKKELALSRCSSTPPPSTPIQIGYRGVISITAAKKRYSAMNAVLARYS